MSHRIFVRNALDTHTQYTTNSDTDTVLEAQFIARDMKATEIFIYEEGKAKDDLWYYEMVGVS